MAEVTPFRGIRYSDAVTLDDAVAPPYDVISAAQAAALRSRSPYNATHVDLPVMPGEVAETVAYTRSAAMFRTWRADGVLRRDETPRVYLVDQTYRGPDGRERRRRGFVARLRLAAFSEGVVLPHERTHAGPKEDRLNLYRATHADLSQIFLLFPDDDGVLGAALDAAAAGASPAAAREARDGDGNLHRLVPLAGAAVDRVLAGLRGRPLYIADGHHRYETALAYRDERRDAGDHSADTLMVYLCSIGDPGLTVFPTHRLVKGAGVPPWTSCSRDCGLTSTSWASPSPAPSRPAPPCRASGRWPAACSASTWPARTPASSCAPGSPRRPTGCSPPASRRPPPGFP